MWKFISGKQCSIISTPKLQNAYSKYFKLSLTQDFGKVWLPSNACSTSNTNLLQWLTGKIEKYRLLFREFGVNLGSKLKMVVRIFVLSLWVA